MEFISTLLFVFLTQFSVNTTDYGKLVVAIDGIKEAKGEMIIAIFNNETDFLKKEYLNQSIKIDIDGNAKAVFENLPKGNYSISVIHDKNSNGKLDKNFFGIPIEGFGFSNNKMGKFGPPSFEECNIQLEGGQTEVSIKLKHI